MSANGADLGHIVAMLSDVLEAQEAFRAELRGTQDGLKGFRAEMHEFRAETRQALKATRDDVAGLRQAVVEYHSAVIGHGILISDLEDRVRRIEQHLGWSATS